jgi:hypothetical protein
MYDIDLRQHTHRHYKLQETLKHLLAPCLVILEIDHQQLGLSRKSLKTQDGCQRQEGKHSPFRVCLPKYLQCIFSRLIVSLDVIRAEPPSKRQKVSAYSSQTSLKQQDSFTDVLAQLEADAESSEYGQGGGVEGEGDGRVKAGHIETSAAWPRPALGKWTSQTDKIGKPIILDNTRYDSLNFHSCAPSSVSADRYRRSYGRIDRLDIASLWTNEERQFCSAACAWIQALLLCCRS